MKGNIAALVAGALTDGVMPPGVAEAHRYYGRAPGSRPYHHRTGDELRAYRRERRGRNRDARHARRVQRVRGAK